MSVNKPISAEFLKRMRNGIPILDTITNKCFVEQIDKFKFRIILTQGLNRQIRRMCEFLDYKVLKLKRIRIMNIHLDLAVGKWRYLSKEELLEINQSVSSSTKTHIG